MHPRPRNIFIDLLRGISMAAVISLHSLSNYLGNPLVLTIWDLQQFAVQIFVFCSAYLFFSHPPQVSLSSLGAYFIKRFWRLYKPFLIYAVFFCTLVFFIKPQALTIKSVLIGLSLIGEGVDLNWLILLFVQFIPLFMLIQFLYQRSSFWFYTYVLITFATAVTLFLWPFPYNWRIIMWLPWSVMALYSIFYIRNENDLKSRTFSYLLFTTIFALFMCVQVLFRHIHTLYPNKYPPNLLLLSYGVVWIGIFDFLYRKKVFDALHLVRPISFLSKYSFQLFFIHWLILYVFNNVWHLNHLLPWWGYPLVLFPATIFIQLALNGVNGLREK